MIIMKSDKCDYYTPGCEVLEIICEDNMLMITSNQIGGGEDGEMEEGGEI